MRFIVPGAFFYSCCAAPAPLMQQWPAPRGICASQFLLRELAGSHFTFYLAINLIGAMATGITVLVVLVAKFTEGAWITVIMIPLVISLMRAVNRHYVRVAAKTKILDLDISPIRKPIAVLPVSTWNRASQAALQFACSLTPDVQVLHVDCPDEHGEEGASDWQQRLDRAAERHCIAGPRVISVPSPYRFITSPILKHVADVQRELPDRKIAVVIPELVASHWYQYLLHNHRSTALKGLLLLQGTRNVVVINVPWYLTPDQ